MVTNDIKYILNTHVPTIFAALMLLLTACSDEQYDNTRNPGQQPGSGASGPLITVTATQGTRPQTRLGYDDPNDPTLPITVTWTAEDQFYVGKDFSAFTGSNTYLSAATAYFSPFTLSAGGEGSKSAEFTGNQPAEVADGDPLYAFYGDGTQCIAIEEGTLSFDYTKQLQLDNDNKDHLSKADFMVATTTETGRQPVFAFTRLGAMMKFIITLPEAGLKVTKLTLTTTDDSAPFSTATQWNKEAALTSTSKTASTSTTLQLGNDGITLTDNTFTAYMMVAPTTLTTETSPIAGKRLKLQVAAADRSVYTAILNGTDIEQGNYYTVKAEAVILPKEMSFTIRVSDQLSFNMPFKSIVTTTADITVDWGDGNKVAIEKDTPLNGYEGFTHNYQAPGDYTVTISSSQMDDTKQQIPGFYFEAKDKDKLIKMNTSILNAGNIYFDNCFSDCTNLTSLPQGLFDKNKQATSFERCFQNCTNLTSLPQDLFRYNTKANSFKYCFYSCKKLTSVPERLFCNVAVTSYVFFNNCFRECTSLESLPGAMFPPLANFTSCFYGCTGLKSLPEKLFHHKDNNGKYTAIEGNFTSCFEGCTSLASLPEGLFVNKTSKIFQKCFYNCFNLVLNKNIFLDKDRRDTNFTRFKNYGTLQTMNFIECFSFAGKDIGDLIKDSEAPELWDYLIHKDTETNRCFYGTKANNVIYVSGSGTSTVSSDGSFGFRIQ